MQSDLYHVIGTPMIKTVGALSLLKNKIDLVMKDFERWAFILQANTYAAVTIIECFSINQRIILRERIDYAVFQSSVLVTVVEIHKYLQTRCINFNASKTSYMRNVYNSKYTDIFATTFTKVHCENFV